MRNIKTITAAVLGMAMTVATSQAVISLNFSSVPGSTIQFNGTSSSFQFQPSVAGDQWQIGSVNGGTGSAVGDAGAFTPVNQAFTYGPITTSGNLQSADVTGPLGGLIIHSGSGDLTGTINWVDLSTYNFGGSINGQAVINVTGLTYTGTDADLLALASGTLGALDLTFQFAPGETLSDLTSGTGPYNSSYSGSISSVPEAGTVTAGALLLLPFGISTIRILRKNRMA